VVIKVAGLVGPCSAWPRRSTAIISTSALSSATTRISVGPGEQIDTDLAEELAFRFGNISVAGADQHVDRRDNRGADGHRGHRLHAAQDINFVGTAQRHGGDGLGMRLAFGRRVQAITRFTPATRAVTMLIWAEATIG